MPAARSQAPPAFVALLLLIVVGLDAFSPLPFALFVFVLLIGAIKARRGS